MKLRPITSEQYTELEEGYMLLLRAQVIFRRGDAPKTYEKVRSACTSAQGAIRHAQRRAQASGARLIVKLPRGGCTCGEAYGRRISGGLLCQYCMGR